MSSFTRLLLEKGFSGSESHALPHRSRCSRPAEVDVDVPDFNKLLEELDQEEGKTRSVSSEKPGKPEGESRKVKPDRILRGTSFEKQLAAEGGPELRRRCGEAFESVVKDSLRKEAETTCREKPRRERKIPKQPEHWNFSFNVNREVVGAELLELDADGTPQPPTQDLRELRSKGRGRAEALPGLPGLQTARPEPGLARFRPIPCQENEWIEGLRKMAESQRLGGRQPCPSSATIEEFIERGSPLEKRPLRCLRSGVVLSSVDCLCDEWK